MFVLATLNPRSGLPAESTVDSTLYTLREEALEWSEGTVAGSCGTTAIQHLHLSDLEGVQLRPLFSTLEADASLRGLKTLYLSLPRERQSQRATEEELEAVREWRTRRNVEVVFVEEQNFYEDTLLLPEMLERHVRWQ
jgi:hypothetical protein